MPDTLPELVGPVLERICEAASGRKFTKLRHEAKQMLTDLEEVFKPPSEVPQPPEKRKVVIHMSNIEAAAQAEKERLAALLAAKDQALDSLAAATENLGSEVPQSGKDEVAAQPQGSSEAVEATPKDSLPTSGDAAEMPKADAQTVDATLGSLVSEAGRDVLPASNRAEQQDVVSVVEVLNFSGSMSLQAAQDLMEILRVAAESRKVQLVDLALDLIQKLIAHKHIQGPVYSISHRRDAGGKSRKGRATEDDDDAESVGPDAGLPQSTAIELLCRCDDISDDGVELRVLKGLLTAVTSSTVHVHGQALLLAVRTCYNIFLMSRSEVNQTTAKASLTQMLNIVFQRMEAGSETVHASPTAVTDQLGLPSAETSSVTAFVNSFLHEVVSTVDPFGYYAEGIQQRLDDAFVEGETSSQGVATEHGSPSAEDRPSLPSAAQTKEDAAETGAGQAVDDSAAPPQEAASEPLQSNGSILEGFQDKEDGTLAPPSETAIRAQAASIESTLQKDAYLVFRALCKLSIRSSESSTGTDLTVVRGKVLALELVKILLENSGPVFRHSEKFVSAIKQYLCLSLLKNVTSSVAQAQALTCSIFFTLLTKFRHSLKAEIGVFFPMILLRAVEPPTPGANPNAGGPGGTASPIDNAHKAVVMRCIEAVCDNGQLLVDVFVNYDCDLEGANLFERLIGALVRLAQGVQEKDGQASATADETNLRLTALSCLVRTLRALVEWYFHSTPHVASTEAINAPEPYGVQKDWNQLQSLPSGHVDQPQPQSHRRSTGDLPVSGGESPRQATLKRETTATNLFASLTAPLDVEIQAQLKDADPNREAQLLEAWKAYKKGFQEGIALFNKKPKKGIAFLQEQGRLGREPEEVAKFLAKTAGLNKTMIGEYLGEREDFCIKVMHAYVDALDFTGKEFDAALRMFLDGFRLPGEAQKIDRLVEKYAERYVNCNAEFFKSADVAYVLAYSVVMLNTDAHNPQVKNKMTKQGFLRNNQGINDGADLPEEYMSRLYESIVSNEIKMKDSALDILQSQQNKGAAGWMDTILNLIPGRKQHLANEPSEEAIRRTHDFLREKAKGATFFEATEGETVRPMLEVCWAPMLGAFSVLFEEFSDGVAINMCLAGMVAAIRITSLLSEEVFRNAFVTSVCRLTMLHAPAQMQVKNAKAFRALLVVADENGNHLHEVWQDVLRCVSRWELLQTIHSGGPSDAVIFAQPSESPTGNKRRNFFSLRPAPKEPVANGKVSDSFNSVHEVSLHYTGRGKGGKGDAQEAPPPDIVIQEIDSQELNRVFVRSERLDSEAIVEFVTALVVVANEELKPVNHPRVYSLTKIVEISHFNMARIRLVWNRIWAVLADFFVSVGCHKNLQVAMFAVDSLRQLAMKFLERDELANYSFQTAFLTPLVVVMRQSKAVEIRELIIRCVSQMVLARVNNVKSGWKSMFMVFTTAASDESQMIVRLAFETIEKIVREHFDFITETEVTTFTDCVNCLIAFTNNPHSLDVALNAIAFLRFCAMKLAEGAIGDVEELPEGTQEYNPSIMRIRPSGQPDEEQPRQSDDVSVGAPSPSHGGGANQALMQFGDKNEHVYFWFPLLAGLSELTFDPRPDIRYSALEVLFDTLKFHGAAFTTPFWTRIFDSVLLPIFDHVRAEVTDTTTFTDEKRRAEVDAWLYETCTQCLQHMVDLVVQFYSLVQPLLTRILDLLSNFIRRPHQSLASVGVAALVRLAVSAGDQMSPEVWEELLSMLSECADAILPDVESLLTAPDRRGSMDSDFGATPRESTFDSAWSVNSPSHSPRAVQARALEERRQASLSRGSGARRLNLAKSRANIQLLIVQASGEMWSRHGQQMSQKAVVCLLDILVSIGGHAREVNANPDLRHQLAAAQFRDQVPEGRELPDPPLLILETEAGHAYLSMLNTLYLAGDQQLNTGVDVEDRLMTQCAATLERFEGVGESQQPESSSWSGARLASVKEEATSRAPLVVATLKALGNLTEDAFRRRLQATFPLLTRLIACPHAPPEIQVALSELFTRRIGPLLV